jgi:glycosyltransferase involved in cell wall biosynthesis
VTAHLIALSSALENKSTRVAFVLQDTGTMYGAERATVDLATGLREYTPTEVEFILIHETRLQLNDSRIQAELNAAGIPFRVISTGSAFSLPLVQRLRAAFAECGADCVHAVGYKAVFHCALAGIVPGSCPWVSTVHGWLERRNLKERIYKWLEVRALRSADKVIVLSRYYHDLLTGLGIRSSQSELIPSGLRLEGWQSPERLGRNTGENTPICIGILGRLSDEKNHAMFLRVADRLVATGATARFIIAGDGPLRPSLAAQIDKNSLAEHVQMAGVMDRSEFFRECDVLVSCSRIENLPYSILEAMACSIPVVATDVGGVSDLVNNGETGFLVALDDDDSMLSRLKLLIDNPDQVSALGTAANRHIQEHFSLAEAAERHFTMYTQVIG